jgi:predicted DsbA family dithiol-disulfide isomerase
MESLTIDVWADVLCPWCYLGEQRLSVAIERSAHPGDIDLRIHTFQLDPAATTVGPLLDYLSAKLGTSAAQAREMENRMGRLAKAEGLPYEADRVAGSTFDMLRLVHLGDAHRLGWDYLRAMQSEMFGGNLEIFDHKTLVRLGENLGIDGAEIRDVLASDRYADDVRADHNTAIRLGARGVPFTVLGNRLGIPGAVSTSQYAAAIDQAWEQING